MSYLSEFQSKIKQRDFIGLMQIWEEYCTGNVEAPEFLKILELIHNSELSNLFGPHAESAIDLWKNLKDEDLSYKILSCIIDLQTTNSPELAKITLDALKKKYSDQKFFKKKMHLVGLRDCKDFQGAIKKYELLSHLNKERFVYHTGGWGVGEIIEISTIREQMVVEFDSIDGFKEISFKNALKNFIPLPNEHFYARRFGFPDELEKEARKNPIKVIKLLLHDLGPKTAAEIKDNLCDLVIPQKDWSKWWQLTRAKLKKDQIVESPTNIQGTFALREEELSHEKRFILTLEGEKETDKIIQIIYKFMRDFPEAVSSTETRESLKLKLDKLLESSSKAQALQIHFLLIDLSLEKEDIVIKEIEELEDFEDIHQIEIGGFKKRALVLVKKHRKDWANIFLSMILTIKQNLIRDYLLQQLNTKETKGSLKERLLKLMNHPSMYPDAFVWYFQKLVSKETVQFNDKEGKCCFFESFFALMHTLERNNQRRDLLKKMHNILCENRYAIVRSMIADTDIEFVKELLLLITKSQTLTDHDIKIMHSLAKVVHPVIFEEEGYQKYKEEEEHIIWTTQNGYLKIQDRIKQIAETEMVENAKEVEEARAFGDLRENSEFKAATERRDRLQAELKLLSDQINSCRILTKEEVPADKIGVGSVVKLTEPQKETILYTILGPWDADPDNNVISFQSKFAQAMLGHKKGDKFKFQGQEFIIKEIGIWE